MAEPMFSLKRKSEIVPIEQEDGTVVEYEIRRATGTEIEAYLDENQARIQSKFDGQGNITAREIKSYKGLFVSLLKRCLYKNDTLVSKEEIALFPLEVQRGLYEIAQTVNGLNPEGEKNAKNSQTGTELG